MSVSDTRWAVDRETYQAIKREVCGAVVRALTAQAWAVACMVWWTEQWAQELCGAVLAPENKHRTQWALGINDASTKNLQRLASLPAPADLAAELLL